LYFLKTHVFIGGGDSDEKNRIWIKANKKVIANGNGKGGKKDEYMDK